MQSRDSDDSFAADASRKFFLRTCSANYKEHDKKEPVLSKGEFRRSELLCLHSKSYRRYDTVSNRLKFRRIVLNKRIRILEQIGDGPLEKYRKVLDDALKIESTIRSFRTKDHIFATSEQIKQGLLQFYPESIVEADGIHTNPLNL